MGGWVIFTYLGLVAAQADGLQLLLSPLFAEAEGLLPGLAEQLALGWVSGWVGDA